VQLISVIDRGPTVRSSLHDTEETLLIATLLVIAVVFVFLRNVRATLIPAVVLPVSLIGTCSIMYLLGYSLDNLSLMALIICTGFVVDDAIVVLENIARYQEMGMRPLRAALMGTREVGFTVLSMTLSLVAVFIPDSSDGQHRRPPVSRVRGDPQRRPRAVDDRVPEPDPGALRDALASAGP
jgi:multidrug efflux pump